MMDLDLNQPATLRWYNIPSDDRIDRGYTRIFDRADEAMDFYRAKLTAAQRMTATLAVNGQLITSRELARLTDS